MKKNKKSLSINPEIFKKVKMNKKFVCVICDKQLKEYGKSKKTDNTDVIPALENAIVCRSWGNFGSSIYDPMPLQHEEFLEFYICDNCCKKKAEKINSKKAVINFLLAQCYRMLGNMKQFNKELNKAMFKFKHLKRK